MNPECDGCGSGVVISIFIKKKLNIGAGGRWVDNLFEAADSGDVLAHPRITCVFVEILNRLCVLAPPTV